MAEIARAVMAEDPGCELHIRTEARPWHFPAGARVSSAVFDVGMIQDGPLDVDLPRTFDAHQRILSDWDALLAREEEVLRRTAPDLVLGDIPPAAFAAARRAGVPAVACSNFSWDEVLDAYAPADAAWRPIVARYREAYALADKLFRLPMHGPMSAFRAVEDVPLLARRSSSRKEETLAALGLSGSDGRRLILVSLGGFGHVGARFDGGEDLSAYRFVAFGPRPDGFAGEWTTLPERAPVPHVDLMAAADAAIGKPGYSTLAEALTHRTRMLLIPRDNYAEARWLTEGADALGVFGRLERADFFSGRWKESLEALFDRPARWADIPLDGARVVARKLLSA
ncbi:MAG: hypothetical protein HY078_16640 [Elusimicrobia bacterium]|nr:hypothetical protein [Elusimicrobiota bacterium]